MPNPISKIAIYAKDMPKTSEFYQRHFDFRVIDEQVGQLIELEHAGGGCNLVVLQASKGHRVGQSCVKIVFDVADVEKFKAQRAKEGLEFGTIHRADGYAFANARDPGKNPIQISSRVHRPRD